MLQQMQERLCIEFLNSLLFYFTLKLKEDFGGEKRKKEKKGEKNEKGKSSLKKLSFNDSSII